MRVGRRLFRQPSSAMKLKWLFKVRDRLVVATDIDQADLQAQALALPTIQQQLAGKQVRKVIVVPQKLINIAAS